MIGGALAVIYLIWAGIQYIQAGGDASKAKAARASIINAIIGIVVILSTYTIIRFAGSIANNIVSSP
jgi:threonine/homoserine/homoserine lactone efflux protein